MVIDSPGSEQARVDETESVNEVGTGEVTIESVQNDTVFKHESRSVLNHQGLFPECRQMPLDVISRPGIAAIQQGDEPASSQSYSLVPCATDPPVRLTDQVIDSQVSLRDEFRGSIRGRAVDDDQFQRLVALAPDGIDGRLDAGRAVVDGDDYRNQRSVGQALTPIVFCIGSCIANPPADRVD